MEVSEQPVYGPRCCDSVGGWVETGNGFGSGQDSGVVRRDDAILEASDNFGRLVADGS